MLPTGTATEHGHPWRARPWELTTLWLNGFGWCQPGSFQTLTSGFDANNSVWWLLQSWENYWLQTTSCSRQLGKKFTIDSLHVQTSYSGYDRDWRPKLAMVLAFCSNLAQTFQSKHKNALTSFPAALQHIHADARNKTPYLTSICKWLNRTQLVLRKKISLSNKHCQLESIENFRKTFTLEQDWAGHCSMLSRMQVSTATSCKLMMMHCCSHSCKMLASGTELQLRSSFQLQDAIFMKAVRIWQRGKKIWTAAILVHYFLQGWSSSNQSSQLTT